MTIPTPVVILGLIYFQMEQLPFIDWVMDSAMQQQQQKSK
jgi:hypothetical protein